MCFITLVCAHTKLIYVKNKGFFAIFPSKDLVSCGNRRTFASSLRQKVIRFLG